MLDKDKLKERLLKLDVTASSIFGKSATRFKCYIAGGSAFILQDYLSRATRDVDTLWYPPEALVDVMQGLDINANVMVYNDCFADGFQQRAIYLDMPTNLIDFYLLSLEDLVISKIASSRSKDAQDIRQMMVVSNLNWNLLDELADIVCEGMLSDYRTKEFQDLYKQYKEEYKK